jgi:hypothetical protein
LIFLEYALKGKTRLTLLAGVVWKKNITVCVVGCACACCYRPLVA